MKLIKMPNSINDISEIDGSPYILSNGMYKYENNAVKSLLTFQADSSMGGWIEVEGQHYLRVVDREKYGYRASYDLNGVIVKLRPEQILDRYAGCICIFDYDDCSEVFTSDISKNRVVIEDSSRTDESSNCIFSRSDSDEYVQCFNSDLEKVWECRFEHFNDSSYIGACRQPYFTEKAYIYYQGIKDDQKQVIAINKMNGETLWLYSTTGIITSLSQYEGVTCLMVNGNLIQLDSDTGVVIEELPSGLAANKFQTFIRDDKYLYFTCHVTSEVRIFDARSQCLLHTVKIPAPFTTSRLQLPVCYDDGLLLNLHSRLQHQVFTTYGVLHINKEEIASHETITLTGEKEPNHSVVCLEDANGEDYYEIMLVESDIDLVERFTEVYVADIASKFANQAYPAETLNKRFGGKIIVKIKKEIIKNPDEERLNESIKRLDWLLDGFWPGVKNGKKHLNISWQWV